MHVNLNILIYFFLILKRRINLEKENEKIRKELESANAQITSLKNVMSSIVNSDKINLVQDKLDSFNLKTKDSEA
jgi:hypothetical protein